MTLLGRVLFGLLPGGPPVLEEGEGGGGLGVGGHHPIVGLVGGDGVVDQPRPDQLQGFAFPRLLLAAVLNELRGAESEPQGAEAPAGVDRRQLPVIADQDHLGLGLVGVLEQPGELAAAQHAGLIHHQHCPAAEGLMAVVEVAQQAIAGGHVLEPLTLQAQGGDPGRGGGQEPVAVQLPGMAGNAEGEGLARPRPSHDHGDTGAALAQISDHRLLIRPGSGMRGQGLTHPLMGGDRRLLARPAGGAGDEPLLDRQQVGGGPAAFLQGPVGDHTDRPLGQEPVDQLLQLAPSGPGQAGAQGNQDVGTGEGGRGRGQPGRAGQPIEQPTGHLRGQRPVLVAVGCPVGHLTDEGVRVVAALGRLGPPPVILGCPGLHVPSAFGSRARST
jgi:hypothetical protein